MTVEQLEETQRRQITYRALGQLVALESMAHLWFWKESTLMGCGPCWQWPYRTQQALRDCFADRSHKTSDSTSSASDC